MNKRKGKKDKKGLINWNFVISLKAKSHLCKPVEFNIRSIKFVGSFFTKKLNEVFNTTAELYF